MKTKNKKAEQASAKKKHFERLKLKWRLEVNLVREEPKLDVRPTILIVCEGENTEPTYFRQFRLSSATIKAVGEGFNTISLMNRAIQLANQKKYEQVWCVFDKDDFSNDDFNSAIILADKNNFMTAYSNQAFEYWIILHFDDHQGGGMHRNQYDKKINSLLNPFKINYDGSKSKIVTDELFEILDGIDEKYNKARKLLAIERAKRNYDKFNHSSPATEESSTTVFKLVEELLKYV